MSTTTINLYGYTPTEWVGWTAVVVFAISTVTHVGQVLFVKPRLYWILPTIVLCGIFEIIGWFARAQSSKDPTKRMNFIIQTSLIILAPVFFTAALYTTLGRLISIIGEKYSRLRSKSYLKVFLGADTVSLFIQGGGGGLSASAGGDASKAKLGTNITLAGVIFQIVSMFCFSVLGLEVAYRVAHNKPHVRTREDGLSVGRTMSAKIFLMMVGLAVATVLVFIRSVYRAIELSEGFNGPINTTEIWVIIFDGLPMALAMLIFNVLSPTRLLKTKGDHEHSQADALRLNPLM